VLRQISSSTGRLLAKTRLQTDDVNLFRSKTSVNGGNVEFVQFFTKSPNEAQTEG